MRALKLISAALMGLVNPAIASEHWVLNSPDVLVSDANSAVFSRLEINATQDCKAVEFRLWAEIPTIHLTDEPNTDMLELAFAASDTILASQGRLIQIYEEFVPNTDIAHITLGAVNWDILEYIERLGENSMFTLSAHFLGGDIKNVWEISDLPIKLNQLRLDCKPDISGTLT